MMVGPLIPPRGEERFRRVLVSEVMSPRLITVTPDASVADAARLMKKYDVGSVLVVNEGRAVGIVTERDIVTRFAASEADRRPSEVKVSEIMTRDLIKIGPGSDVIEAARLMAERNVRRLVVVDRSGDPVGMLTARDILRVAPHIVFLLSESLRIGSSIRI